MAGAEGSLQCDDMALGTASTFSLILPVGNERHRNLLFSTQGVAVFYFFFYLVDFFSFLRERDSLDKS